ncbi:MAG: hypothetical protein WD021_09140, partial [Rhodothermales bacterium]
MIRVTVDTPPDFRFRATLLSHGWVQLAPFDHDERFDELERIHRLQGGRLVRLTCSATPDDDLQVVVEPLDGQTAAPDDTSTPLDDESVTLDDRAAQIDERPAEEISRAVRDVTRRIFNLDIDLTPFYDLLDGMDRYDWVRTHGAGRLLRAASVWEDLAKTLLTTNTSWEMTRRMVARLNEMGDGRGGEYAFPSAAQVASVPFEAMAAQVGAGYRNAYLYELATRIAEGDIDVEAWERSDLPSEDLFRELRSLSGFGPYAAGSTLKLLGRFDYLALDSVAR